MLDLWTNTPSKPHSPKTPNPPTQAISLPEKKTKKLVDTPAASSRKKTKNPIDNSLIPSTYIDPAPKKLQEEIQQYFPVVPTNREEPIDSEEDLSEKSTRNASGKPNVKHLGTSDPIQVSSDLESPHKILRGVSAKELEPDREEKYEPIPPHKPLVTPTSKIPTPDPKTDRLSTSFKGSKPSSEISDHTPAIEKLQHENVQLLQ